MSRRATEVSRIEGFSDAVFGFALTLLVVSLEIPEDIGAFRQAMTGFVPFAATFAIISWIWYEHYQFFRSFPVRDTLTIWLNAALLFVVLFYVYPLKFVFTRMYQAVTNTGPAFGGGLTADDGRFMLLSFSAGFLAVFALFALLHWNAHRQRHLLALEPLELYDLRAAARAHLLSVAVGAVAVVLTIVVPADFLWIPGSIFWLLGPLHGTNGFLNGRQRRRMEALS